MTKDDITAWALANGWQMIDAFPSLTKPSAPHLAIVRLVLKATVAGVEIKKPAGKWEKVSGESYAKIQAVRNLNMTNLFMNVPHSWLTVRTAYLLNE